MDHLSVLALTAFLVATMASAWASEIATIPFVTRDSSPKAICLSDNRHPYQSGPLPTPPRYLFSYQSALPLSHHLSQEWDCFFWCTPDFKANHECDCGKADKVESKSISAIPWQIQVLKENNGGFEFVCSGALLAKNKVVTAAHCFTSCLEEEFDPAQFRIVVGKSCLNDPKDNVLISKPKVVHLHPDFKLQVGYIVTKSR